MTEPCASCGRKRDGWISRWCPDCWTEARRGPRPLPLPPPPMPVPGPGTEYKASDRELLFTALFSAALLVALAALFVVAAAREADRMRARIRRVEVQLETVRNTCEACELDAGNHLGPDRSER